MSDTVIRVENLGKRYRIGAAEQRPENLGQAIGRAAKSPFKYLGSRMRAATAEETLWALRGVSFEVRRGEVVGIIGRNGAGKSTLLKILTRITDPSEGRAIIRGRIGSLLEVGTGFHMELTGRENIYMNGAILGMKKAEIDRKFDEIVDFSGIRQFLDTPVKRYSSGMNVRLGFAVAAHLEPEILLVDEVLAVGDAAFQRKCLGRMGDVAREGRTILFVSHAMPAIENLCTRALLIDGGQVEYSGLTSDVVSHYLNSTDYAHMHTPIDARLDRRGSGNVRISGFYLEDDEGRQMPIARSGQNCTFCFSFERSEAANVSGVSVAFAVFDIQSRPLFRSSSESTNTSFAAVPRAGVFRCRVPSLPLIGGEYTIGFLVTTDGGWADYLDDAAKFAVENGDFYGTGRVDDHSPFLVRYSWELGDATHS